MRALFFAAVAVAACGPSTTPAAQSSSGMLGNVAAPDRSAEPHTLADLAGVRAVALDAAHVYVILGDGALGRIPRRGGAVEPVAPGHTARALAVTDAAVWWVGAVEGGLARADKATGRITSIPIDGAPYLYDLVATGRVAWVGGGDFLYRIAEDEALAIPIGALAGSSATELAAGDGELVVAMNADLHRLVGGTLHNLDNGVSGSPIAVGGGRIATGWTGVEVLGVDGRDARRVTGPYFHYASGMVGMGASAPAPGGVTDFEAEAIDVLAGGGGRLAVSISDVVHHVPNDACGSCMVTTTVVDGTSVVSLITAAGTLDTVATAERSVATLAVDASGVVWSTPHALRAADR